MTKRNLCVVALAFALTHCSTPSQKTNAMVNAEAEKQAEFDRGMRALEAEDYAEAASIFDRVLLQNPGRDLDLVTLYDSGAAYEGLGECDKAAQRYRQVVRSSAGKFKRIEGEALFHLSLMYECLGQDAKTVTALLDARKRGNELPFEVLNAEVPARLAAAYARLGNRSKALEYFNRASHGLKGLVTRGGTNVPTELITRTLFLMGQLSVSQRRAEVEPTTYLQSISIQQPYLLQAMEMNQVRWSPKAEADLHLAYENIWKFKFTSPELEREFYTRSLQTINELRKIRMPDSNEKINTLFAYLDKTERQLQTDLAKIAATNPLTPEAARREGMVRQGQLVDPATSKSPSRVKK